jgi:CubicO group peptidase (beta-lactamase class C family)
VSPRHVERVALSYATGPPALPPLSTVLEHALGLPPDEITVRSNDRRFLTGVVPSGNVVTIANEFSRFFELLLAGGELDGVRVLEPRTIRRAISERAFREIDLSLVAPVRHASGFMLGAKAFSLFGPATEEAFGHLGFTNVLGWADPERALSVGLMTSGKPLLHPGAERPVATHPRDRPGGAEGDAGRYLVHTEMTHGLNLASRHSRRRRRRRRRHDAASDKAESSKPRPVGVATQKSP